ncbi:MAG TPA: 50S ribosomal protein L10 [Candidatus Eisenbacteria bacterium]|nr:50S ribosomal protein L10 [Candidatus Eisenbacteria bacterium]
MPTAEKQRIIEDTSARLEGVRGVFLADFSGMTVEKISLLRKQCREQQIQFHVVKNTLLKRALNAQGISALDEHLNGPTGVVFSPVNELAPAKILVDFAKAHERPRVKAAFVDGRLFDQKSVGVLATLPSREVLLSQVLSTFIAPMTQFLAAIEATLRLPATMADVLEREKSKTA